MGKVVKAIVGVAIAVVGIATGHFELVMVGLSLTVGALTQKKPPKQSPASQDRLRAGIDTRAFRKIVFGHTATALDVSYQEFTGTNQEYLNSIIDLASHELHSIDEIWFDDKMAWSSGGGVTSTFSGYLDVTTRTAGTTANAFTITGSSSWTSSASRNVGVAYIWLRYKLTGNSKKAESPFASSVTSRITVRSKAALMYDPRLDSTAGGSGSHRATDQTTWAWVSDDVGRNPALQLLWYLLGWRIQNPSTSAWKLAVGLGLPVARIDLASFIAAANICDEAVTLAAGGAEPRYRSDGVFSEGDDPSLVFENLLSAMAGTLRDAGGKLVLDVLHNDLSSYTDLTAADVVGAFTWSQPPAIDQSFNVVRGRYVDASDASLYQMADYPDVPLASPDGIERTSPYDLPTVQSASQAQRLAKQHLQRAQYPGVFSADFLASAWKVQVGKIVRLTFPPLGFSNKLFRVAEHTIKFDGTCPMTLREESAAIYVWSAEESPAVVAAAPISYDPVNSPIVQAIADNAMDIAGVGEITISADYAGTVTTGLPRTQAYALLVDGSDVTTSAAWSVSVLTGTISASIGTATGLLSLDLNGGVLTNATVRVEAVYQGVTKTADIKVTKENAPAPSSGSGGGSADSASFTGTTNSTAMVAIGPELTAVVGSAGQVALAANYDFSTGSISGSFSETAQWYRWNGSAYVAIGSATACSNPYVAVAGDPGNGDCNFLDTGLTVASSQKYQLWMKNTAGTVPRTIWGDCAAVAS